MRSVGPVMLSAATTSPLAPRTGAAIAASPDSSSSIAVAKAGPPHVSSSVRSRSGSVIVSGVYRVKGRAGAVARPKAMNTLPTAVQW